MCLGWVELILPHVKLFTKNLTDDSFTLLLIIILLIIIIIFKKSCLESVAESPCVITFIREHVHYL